jgi:hypothetical protein
MARFAYPAITGITSKLLCTNYFVVGDFFIKPEIVT